jgi:hypothetical protein
MKTDPSAATLLALAAVIAQTGCAARSAPALYASADSVPSEPRSADPPPASDSSSGDGRTARTFGWVSIAVGAEAAVVALVTSALMLNEKSTRDSECNAQKVCSQDGLSANSSLASLGGWNAASCPADRGLFDRMRRRRRVLREQLRLRGQLHRRGWWLLPGVDLAVLGHDHVQRASLPGGARRAGLPDRRRMRKRHEVHPASLLRGRADRHARPLREQRPNVHATIRTRAAGAGERVSMFREGGVDDARGGAPSPNREGQPTVVATAARR